jgi:Ni2+-binding GTPase involved in maturation of urease and hydrogenase
MTPTMLPVQAAPLGHAAAEHNRRRLEQAGVVAVLLSGPSGSGKSALIRATAQRLGSATRLAAIIAHPVAGADERLGEVVPSLVAVETLALGPEELADALDQLKGAGVRRRHRARLDGHLIEGGSCCLT